MTLLPDLVRLSRLDTQFSSDPQYVQHVQYVAGSTPRQRRVRKEEIWKRERWLGQGGFGTVESQRCIRGGSEGKVRAVKKVQKLESSNYYRELEAFALFSHSKYEQFFVKSFGWYDDNDNIFITMEYLPHGDLHKYLGSPLPEKQAQHIIFQIVEGLESMHDNGFAHRDLKPANILVVHKGPDWWIKIADFGISKRAIEGVTALRTLTGTPAFTAPEVLGLVQLGDIAHDSYTSAVDFWSLGVITFLILTGETLFKDQRRLGQYVSGSLKFPLDVLVSNKVSALGCQFVRSSMAPKFEDRPGAKDCLQHPWLDHLIEDVDHETQRELDMSNPLPTLLDYSGIEPSASLSTPDQISASEKHDPMGVHADRAAPISKKAIPSLSTLEPATQTNWKKGITFEGHSSSVCAVAFSPDGKQLASASPDKTVRLWDSATGVARHTLHGHSNAVSAVAFSPDGRQIASASWDMTVRLWGLAMGMARHTLQSHSNGVTAVSFSPDGKHIASASWDKTVRVWDSATGALRYTLQGHLEKFNAVAFSPDGKQIASASNDHTVWLWDSATGPARHILHHSDQVNGVAFSPDGNQIASASDDHTVQLQDSAMGAARHTLQGHSSGVNAVAFSLDGKYIASASSDKTVRVWDSATGAARQSLQGHFGVVWAVAFSPASNQIASASFDGKIQLWDSTTEVPKPL